MARASPSSISSKVGGQVWISVAVKAELCIEAQPALNSRWQGVRARDRTCPVIQRGREQRAACAEDADLPARASWTVFTTTLMS